jgi:hypothetical protein
MPSSQGFKRALIGLRDLTGGLPQARPTLRETSALVVQHRFEESAGVVIV